MKTWQKEFARKGKSSRTIQSTVLTLAAAFAALVAGMASHAKIHSVVPPAAARKAAPEIDMKDVNGAPIRLANYRGRVVVLDFWATWCHGCKLEIPWFMEFEDKYKAEGLSVIGVSMDDDGWKSVKPFVAEKKMNYTVVIGNDGLAKHYGLSSMPMTVLIDRQGRIADKQVGVVDRAKWESEIRTLLRESVEQVSH